MSLRPDSGFQTDCSCNFVVYYPRMAKILIVTKNDLRHQLFLRLAQQELGDTWWATCIQSSPLSLKSKIASKVRAFAAKPTPDSYIQEEVGLKPLLDPPRSLITSDPNSVEAISHLLSASPDLVLVYGASILAGEWLTFPRLGAINMHYGILPYYRSSFSTQFALLHERPDRIGATIHYLDAGIDTGGIISRHHVPVNGVQPVNKLVGSVYVAGARALLAEAKRSVTANEKLPASVEKVERSFYPARCYTLDVAAGATWRMNETGKTWPATQNAIEKRVFRRSLPLRRTYKTNGVYILLYHSVVEEAQHQPWERSYGKIATSATNFKSHIDWMISEGFEPIALSDAPEKLRRGSPDKPYFAVTFDDAYANIAAQAPFLASRKIVPTVFVNGSFCEGAPYFRVLAALLRDHPNGPTALHEDLSEEMPEIAWSNDPATLFNQTKDIYVPGKIESAVIKAYSRTIAPVSALGCHLDTARLQLLRKQGWQFGNHTWDHKTLSALDDVTDGIESNAKFLRDSDLDPIDWLSYPNGLARHVNTQTKSWLDQHPEIQGLFAGGGVNLIASRTQWLRISVGNENRAAFKQIIAHNLAGTKATMKML